MQKPPSRGVLRKRCSENMQQIYRRTPMPKCNFNKVSLEYWNRTSAWVFSCKFAVYIQNTCLKNTSGWLLLNMIHTICLLIHVFHNDAIYSTEYYDPQYQSLWRSTKKVHAKLPSSRAFIITLVRFTRTCEVE